MIVTALLGTSIAAVSGVAPAVNTPTGLLTAYLVCTALMTVRPPTPRSRRVSIGDLRVVRSGTLRGAPRLARHLWRMCFALAIAALSFFVGQAKVFPKPIRILPLLAVPLLAVLVTMFYWLWRARIRRNPRGIAGLSPSEAT